MKILLDLQGCQAIGSRHRGIGRYSLALAKGLVRNGPHHEFHLLLNGAFPDTVDGLRGEFEALLPEGRIHVFMPVEGAAEVANASRWRTLASEAVRRAAIRAIAPDVVHVGSLFEGLVDDCTTSIGGDGVPTAVTLYDLIPLLHAKRYLAGEQVSTWYRRKIESLERADLLLGISASACEEARRHLKLAGSVVNVSSAADPAVFHPGPAGDAPKRLGLRPHFIMYTGGIDWRKNIEGLVRAYAMLRPEVRATHQLVLVCQAEAYARTQVLALARDRGLGPDDVVFTGFVSDEDLASLYRSCSVFVFPSLHEGFGLPALEAMMCGAPVIGSNTTSIPEVIGRDDAMFDPASDASIADHLQRAIDDEDFSASLRAHAPVQAAKFSWEITAQRALEAIERLAPDCPAAEAPSEAKPRLAMHAPLPPARSGIADYTSELLQVLRAHYEIELVADQPEVDLPPALQDLPVRSVQWFRQNASRYDRIVYQFGNSMFHAHMFPLLREHPGVVVLHDFYLSGVMSWLDSVGGQPGLFRDALMGSHGPRAVAEETEVGRDAVALKYPLNGAVLRRATGMIVHSRYAIDAANRFYGDGASTGWHHIPHLRVLPAHQDRAAARAALGLADDDVLVCSFGHIAPTKLNVRAIEAWKASSLASDPRCRLVLVGSGRPPYGDEVQQAMRGQDRIAITGFAERDVYERYLAAADFALQLRTSSRGETSGAVLDCLAWGVPVIANANGSNAEYPPSVVRLLADEFEEADLVDALESLAHDAPARRLLSEAGRAWIADRHDPARVALQYRDAIEHFHAQPQSAPYWAAVNDIAGLPVPPAEGDLAAAAIALAASAPPATGTARGTPAPSGAQ